MCTKSCVTQREPRIRKETARDLPLTREKVYSNLKFVPYCRAIYVSNSLTARPDRRDTIPVGPKCIFTLPLMARRCGGAQENSHDGDRRRHDLFGMLHVRQNRRRHARETRSGRRHGVPLAARRGATSRISLPAGHASERNVRRIFMQ